MAVRLSAIGHADNPCPICGARGTERLCDQRQQREYRRCRSCGFIHVAPEYQLSSGEEKSRYLQHTNALNDEGYMRFLDRFFKNAVQPYIKTGSTILDFGSGPVPAFSRLLSENGYTVQSYDPLFYPLQNWKNSRFDAIVLIEVLEHLADPVESLKEALRSLKDGGFCILRSNLFDGSLQDFDPWWYRQDPTHISFFTVRAIEELASRLSLEVQAIQHNCEIILHRPNAQVT